MESRAIQSPVEPTHVVLLGKGEAMDAAVRGRQVGAVLKDDPRQRPRGDVQAHG
jgi:hypothetical protein